MSFSQKLEMLHSQKLTKKLVHPENVIFQMELFELRKRFARTIDFFWKIKLESDKVGVFVRILMF